MPPAAQRRPRAALARAAGPARRPRPRFRSERPIVPTSIPRNVLLISVIVPFAANWAQVAGEKLQNVIVPVDSFNPRWGHASVVIDAGAVIPLDETADVPNAVSELFLLGGDDYDFEEGGGGLLNDVWKSVGTRWRTYANSIQTNRRGDPLPKIVSRLQWTASAGALPPRGISYNEWTACHIADKGYTPATPCTAALRDRAARNQWAVSLRWSPRRNLAAATLGGFVYVLGGYARGLEDTPEGWEVVHGGFERRVIWREETLLKNDVWRSTDGVSWELVNPGSLVNQPTHVLGNGSEAFACTAADRSNCTLATSCNAERGTCEAMLWSPRESHAVGTYGGSMYLTGGFISRVTGFCSFRACRIGYSTAVADVWRSSNGRDWTLLTDAAPWAPRGEHALVNHDGYLFLYGGQGRNTRLRDDEPYFNDVWRFAPGTGVWTQVTPAAAWAPRSALQGASANGTLFAIAGRLASGALTSEVWSSSNGTDWTRDYAPGTLADGYASAASDISYLQSLDRAELARLYARGITDVSDVVALSPEQVLDLRDGDVPRICIHLARARALVEKCAIEEDWADGKGAYQVEIERVGRQRPEEADADASLIPPSEIDDPCLPEPDPLKETTWIVPTEAAVNFGELNLTCRAIFTPRHYASSVVMGPLVYIFGGVEADNTATADVWYRDAAIPPVQFTHVPRDRSADMMFSYRTTEPGTVFQAQLERIGEDGTPTVVFPWTKTQGILILNEDTEMETGTHVLRVRALDPAGNVNRVFLEGVNQHTWYYRPDLPWALIILGSLAFIGAVVGGFLEIRRRRKKRAMERYAIKRMRRKFKGIKKDAAKKDVDWRKYYDESKAAAADSLEDTRGAKKKRKKKRGKRGQSKAREAKAKRRGKSQGAEEEKKKKKRKKKQGKAKA